MKHYIKQKKDLIDCMLILIAAGIVTGCLCTSKLNLDDLSSYSNALISTLVLPNDLKQFFLDQTLMNSVFCSVIFLLGFSVLGIPFIQFFVFLKGFQIGFSSSLFLITYQIKGILGIMLTLVPQILFDLIALFVISIASIELSGVLIASINTSKYHISFSKTVNQKFSYFLISLFFVILSSFMKTTLCCSLIELFSQL